MTEPIRFYFVYLSICLFLSHNNDEISFRIIFSYTITKNGYLIIDNNKQKKKERK